jgi:hypothetical protein
MSNPSANDRLFRLMSKVARLPDVRDEVKENYYDNRWWPLAIQDWRLRMLLAGWSIRVSYNMIAAYRRVVESVALLGYRRLAESTDTELRDLVHPIGLHDARVAYFRSLTAFIDEAESRGQSPFKLSNDELISLIACDVRGASYKVAQCATLYTRGYHCGVIPVDSGMVSKLGPVLGLQLTRRSVAHEHMRRHLEALISSEAPSYRSLAGRTGYADLELPATAAPTWWAHLVLIYFKRLYCNHRRPLDTTQELERFLADGGLGPPTGGTSRYKAKPPTAALRQFAAGSLIAPVGVGRHRSDRRQGSPGAVSATAAPTPPGLPAHRS